MRTCYFISFFNFRLIQTAYGTDSRNVSTSATPCAICTPVSPSHMGSNSSAGRKKSPFLQTLSSVAGPVILMFGKACRWW